MITGRASPLPKTNVLSLTARRFVGMMMSPNYQHPGFGRCAARLLWRAVAFQALVFRLSLARLGHTTPAKRGRQASFCGVKSRDADHPPGFHRLPERLPDDG